jgi:hypothetical protein
LISQKLTIYLTICPRIGIFYY